MEAIMKQCTVKNRRISVDRKLVSFANPKTKSKKCSLTKDKHSKVRNRKRRNNIIPTKVPKSISFKSPEYIKENGKVDFSKLGYNLNDLFHKTPVFDMPPVILNPEVEGKEGWGRIAQVVLNEDQYRI